jgi:hypothetical protein
VILLRRSNTILIFVLYCPAYSTLLLGEVLSEIDKARTKLNRSVGGIRKQQPDEFSSATALLSVPFADFAWVSHSQVPTASSPHPFREAAAKGSHNRG